MTTEVEARDILAAAVDAAWKGSQFNDVPLYDSSGPQPKVDVDKVFMQYDIVDDFTEQVTIGSKPWVRHHGTLVLNFAAKRGGTTGERALRIMRQEMKEYFTAEHFGPVKTLIATPRRDPVLQGWMFKSLAVPFYFDEKTT